MCLAGLGFCVHRGGYMRFLLSVSTLSTSRKQKTKATKRRRAAKDREVEEEERKDDAPHFEPIRDVQADTASTVQDRLRSPARNE